jgi:multicomponent Na+:H+ antiporter subunit C
VSELTASLPGNLVLSVVIGVLYAVGVFLLLQRTLTRVIIGITLLGHGANLLLLISGGPAGRAPLVTLTPGGGAGAVLGETSDPLPQAMALTAIVITFALSAFLLALAYRSYLLTRDDEVQDDVEDRRIARAAHTEQPGERERALLAQLDADPAYEGDAPEPGEGARRDDYQEASRSVDRTALRRGRRGRGSR